MIQDNDLVSYYTIANGSAMLKWQANLGKQAGTIGDLFFIKTKSVAEAGTRPSVAGKTLVSFKYSRMADETAYEIINKSGSVKSGTVASPEGKIIVEVPGEK